MRFSNAPIVRDNVQTRRGHDDAQKSDETREGTGQFSTLNPAQSTRIEASYDESSTGQGDPNDFFSALDAALGELEQEHKDFVKETATPTKDAVFIRGQNQGYEANALNVIHSEKVASAPTEPQKPGQNVVSTNANMRTMLQNNLMNARMGFDRMRSARARMG